MIIGRTLSIDGNDRRKVIRHSHIIDPYTKQSIYKFLQDKLFDFSIRKEWIGYKDIFPNIPEDIINTPLKVVYDACLLKCKDSPNILDSTISKNLGILFRESVYYSDIEFYEIIDGSVRKYKLVKKEI